MNSLFALLEGTFWLIFEFVYPDLQEVFYNIPGANIEPSEGVDVFEVAISKLDSYFAPKQSRVYERHTFRLLKQEPEENLKILVKLRKQADKYRVITEANTLELVNKQLEEFKDLAKSNGNEEVNKVNSRFKRNFDKPRNVQHGCGRCGNPRHVATDTKCPARDKECLKCGLKGHFRQYCRTRQAFKRKIEKEYSHDQKKGRIEREKNEVNQLRDSSNEMAQKEEETEYVFHIDDDVEIDCTIGGVETKMLIDSLQAKFDYESNLGNIKEKQLF
ncbi:hypothetical protein EVAR_56519_1 [Eumeta japonica]|uniref:CCHC-type domain-containing protein n=1 Tax=Eumeta variegata TaxID=151549 RepID=A0A4C1ZTI9_EUMVA|nr:hypothetical protein EVAR_56519_1 [Eumeta japonica]